MTTYKAYLCESEFRAEISNRTRKRDELGLEATLVVMKHKSKEKFKNAIRDITTRSHNLDQEVIEKLNRVLRSTVNYFGTKFSTMKYSFKELDKWIRRRIRCMKCKRISNLSI